MTLCKELLEQFALKNSENNFALKTANNLVTSCRIISFKPVTVFFLKMFSKFELIECNEKSFIN